MRGAALRSRARPRWGGRSSGPGGLHDDDEAMRAPPCMRTSSPVYPQPGPVGGRPCRSPARCHCWRCCCALQEGGDVLVCRWQRCCCACGRVPPPADVPQAPLKPSIRSFPSPDQRTRARLTPGNPCIARRASAGLVGSWRGSEEAIGVAEVYTSAFRIGFWERRTNGMDEPTN
jgi:hypothetical protein